MKCFANANNSTSFIFGRFCHRVMKSNLISILRFLLLGIRTYDYDRKTGKWTVNTGDQANVSWFKSVLRLNWQESPFYPTWGIPYRQSFMMNLFPTLWVNETITKFSSVFSTIVLTGTSLTPAGDPEYAISIVPSLQNRTVITLKTSLG